MARFLIFTFLISCFAVQAQDPPVKASQYIRTTFPESNYLSWIALPAGFECRFKDGHSFVGVKFTPDGKWLESRKMFGKDETPVLKNIILKEFEGGEIMSIEQVDRTEHTRYEVLVVVEERYLRIKTDSTGKILSKTVIAHRSRLPDKQEEEK